ncbi:titin-like isoform X2 [Artemia franciscana]|uniref:titin-like isoform X2 n=1 Tax=Artemia franciscana TaxID=6661 RepID=UPI0032DB5659
MVDCGSVFPSRNRIRSYWVTRTGNSNPLPTTPIPFVARHPSDVDLFCDPRGGERLKFTSFLGDPPPESEIIEEKSGKSVSQYLSAIRELNNKRDPVFIFSEEPLNSKELIEEAHKGVQFSNPVYQTLSECLSGISPETVEEMKEDTDIHYQILVSNMPIFLDEKVYANLEKELPDEPLYAISGVLNEQDDTYANIDIPIEPIIRTKHESLEKELINETLNYFSLPLLPNDNCLDSKICKRSAKIIKNENFSITEHDDKTEELDSLIRSKAAKTAFMQKLDSQLRSQIKKRVQFAVPEYTAYTLEPFSSIETVSLKNCNTLDSLESVREKLDKVSDLESIDVESVEQVSASFLLEMLESVPALPKPDFRLANESAPPLPVSPPPIKQEEVRESSPSELLEYVGDATEEIVDSVNEVDFRIPSEPAEKVNDSEVIYLKPEKVKPQEELDVSGIFHATLVQTTESDYGETPKKMTPKKNIGEIIVEEQEKALKKKLEMLPDKPEVTVYDLGVSQVEKERNKLIKSQKVKVKTFDDWVAPEPKTPPPFTRSTSIPDSLIPKGWKSPEKKPIKSPRGEVIADSILQQKNDTKTFWENKMIANSLEKDALSPPPGFDDPRADTPISQTSSGSVPLVDVPDDSFISVGDLLPEEEPKKNYMCHDESEEKMNYEESESLIEIAKNTDNPTETFIEKEIRMQKQREKQILAERELAVKNLAIASGKTSVSTTKTIKTINKPNLEFPRSDKHKSAEVLISQEIEDYKRREEELKLRQNLSSSRENLLDDQFASITTTDEGHYSDNDNTSEERESREDTPQNLQKSQSLESLSSGHSSGDVPAYPPVNQLADIKRRRVVVKPFDDGEEPSSIPTFQREQKETPIEREIRLAKEREEELRKNRHDAGIPSWSAKQVKKPEVTKVNGINLKNSNRGVQQHLAASRIQAEINEITEKENELRKAGKIYTTSEETVDEKVQRLSHLAEYSSELQQSKEARKGTTLSRAVSTPQLNTEPDHPRFAQTRNLLTQASFQNQLFKKSLAPPACTNQRGLMQKFINSRGKSTSMSVSSPEPTEPVTVKAIAPKASAVLNQNVTEKFVAKEQQEPPVLPTAVTQKPPAPRRHFLTAEEKIQEEMKEMQRREEELKIQRMRFLGRSQPDLSEFGDGEPLSTKIEDTTPEPPENDTDVVTRRPSHAVNAITAAAKNQRRKSHLIAEWENRIQQS